MTEVLAHPLFIGLFVLLLGFVIITMILLRRLMQNTKIQMSAELKQLAENMVAANNEDMIKVAKSSFEQESKFLKGDFDQREKIFKGIVDPLKEQLDKYQQQVHAIEKDRQRSYTEVEQELKRVVQSNLNLSEQTTALKDALKKPHVRGRWGEVQLKNCVELAGMSEFSDVSFQDNQTTNDGTRLIPDMTVRMPGGRVVVVDSKTPIDAFIASLEAKTDQERDNEMLRHGRHVREHVKKLSSRAYNEGIDYSADFTVMFLPNESFLYAALETQSDIVEYALEKKILIATPPTLIGLLKVIRYGWNEERLAENAERISEAGKELHKRLCDFVSAYVNVGKHLEKAQSEYESGLSRLESRVLVQARRLEKLGAKSVKSLPDEVSPPELTV